MQRIIDKKKDTPLGFEELEKYYNLCTGEKLKIIIVDELEENTTIDKIFDKGCIILYIPIENQYVGHFVSMFKTDKTIYYFDSYGNTPKYLIDLSFEPEENRPFFKIIQDSTLPVIYNTLQYQTMSSAVDNCGRYAVLNCILYTQHKQQGLEYDLDTFYDIIVKHLKKYKYKDYDDAITRMTIDL